MAHILWRCYCCNAVQATVANTYDEKPSRCPVCGEYGNIEKVED